MKRHILCERPLTVVPVTAFWAARSKFPCVIIELVLLRTLRPVVTSSHSGISYSVVITKICLFDGNEQQVGSHQSNVINSESFSLNYVIVIKSTKFSDIQVGTRHLLSPVSKGISPKPKHCIFNTGNVCQCVLKCKVNTSMNQVSKKHQFLCSKE